MFRTISYSFLIGIITTITVVPTHEACWSQKIHQEYLETSDCLAPKALINSNSIRKYFSHPLDLTSINNNKELATQFTFPAKFLNGFGQKISRWRIDGLIPYDFAMHYFQKQSNKREAITVLELFINSSTNSALSQTMRRIISALPELKEEEQNLFLAFAYLPILKHSDQMPGEQRKFMFALIASVVHGGWKRMATDGLWQFEQMDTDTFMGLLFNRAQKEIIIATLPDFVNLEVAIQEISLFQGRESQLDRNTTTAVKSSEITRLASDKNNSLISNIEISI